MLTNNDQITVLEFCYTTLSELAHKSRAALVAGDLELDLLLANDDAPLTTRAVSLAKWCQGFIAGIGLAGLNATNTNSEIQTLLEDFYQIARLDSHNVGLAADEQDETALMELTEYARMGAIFIFEDLQRNGDLCRLSRQHKVTH